MMLHAQCGLNQSYIVSDPDNDKADTTDIKVLVNGAVHNNLASPQQGVCGVKLKFRHPFMKEMFIELIAPSGQKVILTGGDIVPTNTQLISWNVTFVPCSAAAAPDYGFTAVWENNQAWLNLTTYVGQYYPHKGCLEDFNTGTVNGVWTIRCIDFEDGGQGTLQDASIIFCQDEGVFCGECKLNPGVIQNKNMIQCEGSSQLVFDISKVFPPNSFDTVRYVYNNIVFSGDTIIDYIQQADLTNYKPGNYTICGFQISRFQTGLMLPIGTITSRDTLNDYFFKRGICAAKSDDCLEIIISELAPPTEVIRYICPGGSVVMEGTTYTQPGIYIITIDRDICDSLITLDLRTVSLEADITASKDSLDCVTQSVILSGQAHSVSEGTLGFQWFTNDGTLNGNLNENSVEATTKGTYFLVATITSQDYSCKDTTSFYLTEDNSFPKLSFTGDRVINCYHDTVLIIPDILVPVNQVNWSSKEGNTFETFGSSVKVWTPGVYYVSVETTGGCTGKDSVLITEDRLYPEVHFNHKSINCKDSVIVITTVPEVEGAYSYFWDKVAQEYQNVQNPDITKGGIYGLTMTNLINGCTIYQSVTIDEDKSPPIIENIVVDTLTCSNKSVQPKLLPDAGIIDFHWTGNGLNSTLKSPEIKQAGTYQVVITSVQNYCTQSATFIVAENVTVPEISIITDSITCFVDSVQLITTSNQELFNIRWSGPGFNSTGIQSPFVHREGLYTLSAAGRNGCVSTRQIEVVNSKHKPEISIQSDTILCGNESIHLNVTPDISQRSYYWTGPGIVTNGVSNPLVNQPGRYMVTVTNDITGCTFETFVNIIDGRVYSTPELMIPVLDCAHDSIRIVLSSKDVQAVEFWGDNFYSKDISPYISKEGKYYIRLTNTKNCISIDSFVVKSDMNRPEILATYDTFKCGQDSMLIMGTSTISGTKYSWTGQDGVSKSGQQIRVYKGGWYTVTGTAPNGCKNEYIFQINYDTIHPDFNILPADTLTCKNPVISLNTDFNSDQGSIAWFKNGIAQDSRNIRQPGTYIVVATGHNNCINMDSVIVEERKHFPVFEVDFTKIDCRFLIARVEVTPLSEFKTVIWDNANNPAPINDNNLFFNTSFPGIYRFTMTNEEGCSEDGLFEIMADTVKPVINMIVTDTLDCNNPTVDIGVKVEGDVIQYLWNGPDIYDVITNSGFITVADSGVYYLKVTGSNNCVTHVSMEVFKDDNLPVYSLYGDTLTCEKGKVTIGVNTLDRDLEYSWSGPYGFVSNQQHPKVFATGYYHVTLSGKNGCVVRDSIFIPEIMNIPVIYLPDTIYLPCDMHTIQLSVGSVSDLYRHFWVFPDGNVVTMDTLITNIPGKYSVQSSDKYGCRSNIVYFDVVLDATKPDVHLNIDTITCRNPIAAVQAGSNYPYTGFEWVNSFGDVITGKDFSTSIAGSYLLLVANASGCKDSFWINVPADTVRPDIKVDVQGEIKCEKADVTLDAASSNDGNPFTAIWTTQDGNIDRFISEYAVHVNKAGHYLITVTDSRNGCIQRDTVWVDRLPSDFTIADLVITPPYCSEIQNGTVFINGLNGTPPFHVFFNGKDVDDNLYFDGLKSGNYALYIKDANGCIQDTSVIVPQNQSLHLDVESEYLIYFGDSLIISPVINENIFGNHTLKWFVRDTLICDDCLELTVRPFINTVYIIEHSIDGLCKETVSVLVRVNRNLNSAIPNVFRAGSGNGNDLFFIPQTRGIARIKRMMIFDKWAENVYSVYDIPPGIKDTGWDGTFKGKLCEQGVYMIIADLELSNGKTWTYKGDLTLLR